MNKRSLFLTVLAVLVCTCGFANVRLPKAFTDNMVLQRHMPVAIWGWSDPGEEVAIVFAGQYVKTTASRSGEWLVKLNPMPAICNGQEMVITGKNTVVLKNVVVGEVWVCSGQSNMEMPLNSWGQPRNACTDEEISGDYSFVRFNRARHELSKTAVQDVPSDGWKLCKDGVQKDCTACGFHFAVRLHKELGVPVGLIDVNWGGSRIDSWMPDEAWNNLPETKDTGAQQIAKRTEAEKAEYHHAGGMYYGMLAPWVPYAIRGAIWYQGCSNAGEGGFYYYKQKAMIQEWRKVWNQGAFPFYWVQLANYKEPNDDPNQKLEWAQIRDAQTRCMEVENTGQAVIIDIGEEKDIHPRNKYMVGNRLAAWALTQDYGKPVPFRSPLFKEVEFKDGKAFVKFDNVGEGLVVGQQNDREFIKVDGGELKRFAIAGADKVYHWATAKIVAPDTVEVSCPDVPEPAAVRYAWQMNPSGCNLYNAEGLPATPFTSEK